MADKKNMAEKMPKKYSHSMKRRLVKAFGERDNYKKSPPRGVGLPNRLIKSMDNVANQYRKEHPEYKGEDSFFSKN